MTYLAVFAWTSLWPAPKDSADLPAHIICLGAGMSEDGTLHVSSLNRVDSCVVLAQKIPNARVVFTGGVALADGRSAGAQMASYAQTLDLPKSAIVIEPKAQSTLQNAIFSLALLEDPTNVTVVTEPFHLPRAWVSFRWAGAKQVHLVPSHHGRQSWGMLSRETLAIWYNLARIPVYGLAKGLGFQDAVDLLE